MKYLKFILILIITFQINQDTTFAIEDDYVQRQALIGIEWNDAEKAIDAHYIIATKYLEDSYVIEHTVVFRDDSIDEEEVDDIYKAINKRDYLRDDIYHSDIIFGERVPLYKDVSAQNLTSEELEVLKKDVENQAESDFNNPPEINHTDQWSLLNYLKENIVVFGAIIFMLIVAFLLKKVQKK